MRIEILANGASSVINMQRGFSNLHADIESTILALKDARRRIYDLPGGVKKLDNAASQLGERIRREESKLLSVEELSNKARNFLRDAAAADSCAARLIAKSQKRFFQEHERLRPPEKGIKAWWEARVADWNKFWSGVGDAIKSAWDGVVNFVKEHAVELIIGAVAIVVGAALIAITGGGAAALIPALLAGLKAAAISALISGVIDGTIAALTGGDVLDAFGDGLAMGFMFGGLTYLGKGIWAFHMRPKHFTISQVQNMPIPEEQGEAMDHILNGTNKGGYHSTVMEGAKGQIVSQMKHIGRGVYEAEVIVDGVKKYSSFFPKHWSPMKISKAITHVINHGVVKRGSIEGIYHGIPIRVVIKGKEIVSAFPISNKVTQSFADKIFSLIP